MWERNSALKKRSQELRKEKNATKQEKHLWYDYLKQFRPRFHRQVIIHSFSVDFYCPQAKLVIEVDGAQHFEEAAQAYDNERTAVLQGFGCHVLRFTNREIDRQFDGVCSEIDKTVKLLQKGPNQ